MFFIFSFVVDMAGPCCQSSREGKRIRGKTADIMRSKHALRELPESMYRGPVLNRRKKAVVSSKEKALMNSDLSSTSSSSNEHAVPLLTERYSSIDSECTESVELLKSASSRRENVIMTNGRISWVRAAWIVHFLVAVAVMGVGIWYNQQSWKYIPIFPSSRAGPDCERAFLNVMASSESEEGAIICCKNKELSESGGLIDALTSICPSEVPVKILPFADRLAKFPEAWFIPLFPVLFRFFYRLFQMFLCVVSSPLTSRFEAVLYFSYSVRRICLYIILLNFRGWVLYVLFNAIEDSYRSPVGNNCWYNSEWLTSMESSCLNKAFDFSDHVVLYYAQILPISLVETIYAFQYPYWSVVDERATKLCILFRGIRQFAVPLLLAGSHIYLQFITAAGAYKTAAYFHTPREVISGFVVSLLVALPLMCLQIKWRIVRAFFFRYHP